MRASLYLLALASLCLLSLAAATFSSTGRPRVYARNHAHPTKAGSATSLSFPVPRNHKKPAAPPAAASAAAPMTLPLHRHHRWESRPVFFADTPNNQPVQGDVWPVAIFWTYINVGTPGVPFPVAIDTGSNDLDIPFYQCDTCIKKEPNQQYNPTLSSTSQPLPCGSAVCPFCSGGQCQFSNTYQTCDLSNPEAPCTISGLFYQDVVSLGPAGPVNATFGVINYQTSNFDQFKNIDGVLGLAGSLDTAEGQNVFQSLVDAKQVPSNVFAMCFYHGSTSNGTITFGGIDSNLYTGEIAYTENTGADSGFYGVNLEAILVDGQTVDGSANSQTILDSGTNVLLVPDTPFQSFKSIFTSNCAQNPLPGICNTTQTLFDGYCYQLSDEQIAKFPTLTLQLSGVKLVMEPLDYLNVETTAGVYCLGIRNTGADGLFIIGDTTMEDYYVIFDREQSRIGWAPVNTKTCGSL